MGEHLQCGGHLTALPLANCLAGNRRPKLEELSLAGTCLISKRMMQTTENSGEETSVRGGIFAGGFLDEVGAQSLGTDADSGRGEGQEDRRSRAFV